MFPDPWQLDDPVRPVYIIDVRIRRCHLLRLREEMRRRDVVVSAVCGVGDLREGFRAIGWIGFAVDVCVADGLVSLDLLVAQPEGECQYGYLDEAERVHDFRLVGCGRDSLERGNSAMRVFARGKEARTYYVFESAKRCARPE